MNEVSLYNAMLVAWFALAPVTFVVLFFVAAPYGRYMRKGWGPSLNPKIGWALMESPALCLMPILFFLGEQIRNPVAIVFLLLWLFHYAYRTLAFPMLLGKGSTSMPVSVVIFGFVFNVVNGYLIGSSLFGVESEYLSSWLLDARFIVGAGVFFAGFVIHYRADATLRSLRKQGESGYQIPCGGMFRFISCPNYFGEIVEWGGFAVATWSLPTLAFFVWTIANLAPRALSHHRWYKETFAEYPTDRKALIPFLL
jgi:3-oxo-5-alpha-steroid 4-dehydrogenase 1